MKKFSHKQVFKLAPLCAGMTLLLFILLILGGSPHRALGCFTNCGTSAYPTVSVSPPAATINSGDFVNMSFSSHDGTTDDSTDNCNISGGPIYYLGHNIGNSLFLQGAVGSNSFSWSTGPLTSSYTGYTVTCWPSQESNEKTSASGIITLNPPPPPSCTPSWSCSGWGACQSNSTQTQSCTDTNNCGTSSGEPALSQSCTYTPPPPPQPPDNCLTTAPQPWDGDSYLLYPGVTWKIVTGWATFCATNTSGDYIFVPVGSYNELQQFRGAEPSIGVYES